VPLRDDLLDLLAAHDIAPTRLVRLALDDVLAVVAAENPDLPAPAAASDDDDAQGDDDAGLAVRTIACPHCGEPVVVELELDGGDQEQIQDCSVCCRPIRLTWGTAAGGLSGFTSGPG